MLAPWLQAPNVLQIAQAGTQAGLGVRHADLAQAEAAQQAQQAANLLDYHYRSLQAQQEHQMAQLGQEAAATNAANALRAAQERAMEMHRQATEKQASENALALQENRNLNREIRQQNADSAKAARDAEIERKQQLKQQREHSINFWTEWDGVSNPATVIKKYPWSADEPGVRTALNQWAIDQRARAGRQASQTNQLRHEQAALQKRQDSLSEDEKTRLDQITQTLSKPSAPQVGEVVKGFKFLGGDPGNKDSWEESE